MSAADPLARWATWKEIHGQPALWRRWAGRFHPDETRDWIDRLGVEEIWLCGAGTSAYIGDILVAGLEAQRGPRRLRAVPSTDLVSRPAAHLAGRRPLVVSFGRSGNSPETLGTLAALDALAPRAPRLHMTCNPKGALATAPQTDLCRTILLPDAAHDRGFAMTGSFSTMLLTARAVLDGKATLAPLPALADMLETVLPAYAALATERPPERIVFLGTGPLAFAAREAALKVMELTAGRVPALWDSGLGFRHGPKSFVRGDTMVVLFRSGDGHAARYEADLLSELAAQYPGARLVATGPSGAPDFTAPDDTWAAPLHVALAQVLGAVWSDAMGLNVDDPFAGAGTLSRVVSGVTLYPVAP